jgi:hypothetical protein
MNDTAKLALSVGAGMAIGKISGSSSGFWWVAGGLAALFLLNSPSSRKAISSGASQLYSRVKR